MYKRQRLQVEEYETATPFHDVECHPAAVRIKMKQHAGEPAVPVVEAGTRVKKGQVVGRVAEGKLGAHVHASVEGKVRTVNPEFLEIVT